MPTISVWYKSPDGKYEVVDRASSKKNAEYLANEYAIAFGCGYKQWLYGKAKVWAGTRQDEPQERKESWG